MRKRSADEMDTHVYQMLDKHKLNGSEDFFAYVEKYEMKELLSCIMIRLDHQGNMLDTL